MNERIAKVAKKIADDLAKKGFIPASRRRDVMALIGDTLQAAFFPKTCEDCGTPLCPQCANHMEEPDDADKYPFCPDCLIYVKPDGTEVSLKSSLAPFFRKKDWIN